MNYLALCKQLTSEVGVAGESASLPESVLDQTGELARIVKYIRDADLWIQNLWTDWNFLWRELDNTLTSRVPDLPVGGVIARKWDTRAFVLDGSTGSPIFLKWVPFDDFRRQYRFGTIDAGQPAIVTAQPDGALILDKGPVVSNAFHGEYWRKPATMTADTSESDIPDEFHRIIIARAGIMYGNNEDAPELISGYASEFESYLTEMEGTYLPEREDSQSHVTEQMEAVTR